MGREIDERVVEMRFDNKQFESATKETLGTLGRLKEALKLPNLKDSLSGIDEAAKKTKLDGIASAVEALEKRFSTLGIVGMRVIENITDAVMGKLHSALSFVSDSIVSGGIRRATNIENAHFQLQALLKDEAKVQAVMADAMESVDGTAYAYDEAAKAAAQFAASGVQAGEDMLGALKGITGVAAMTNSDFESIARIFTTVAGNGRVMGDQLLQLSSRGLNAASTIADYFREVQNEASITEADIREMVSDGEISFKIFADAMTWAFGDSAKRANETFTGALSNMKSALARIGAEFVSPLIEQNSELVKLFNALRIQINNVKSALAFNEQRSAIAGLTEESTLLLDTVSQFAKDGTNDITKYTDAIIASGKGERELAKINEELSASYEEVRKSGNASVDTLAEFNKHGINAAQAVKEYINGVLDGTIRVSSEVKSSIEEITGGIRVTGADIVDLANEGKLSFDIFTDAIVNASGAMAEGSEFASDAITHLMSKVKEAGSVSQETLDEFQKNGIKATGAIRDYINGVQDGTIRASYATTSAIEDITGGVHIIGDQVKELAADGKISYEIFQSAMEHMYGTEKALSKQFTDFVLDNIKQLTDYINSVDLTKPLEALYYMVEAGKNVFKGLYSVIKPIGKAFADVFLGFDGDALVSFTAQIERLTAKLKLSEKNSEDLGKAFKGVFDVVKLVMDIFAKLLRAILPIGEPVGDLGDGFLSLAGNAGEALSKFTEWVRSSTKIKNVYNMLSEALQNFAKYLKVAVENLFEFLKYVKELPVVEKLLNALKNSFGSFLDNIGPFFDNVVDKVKNFKEVISDVIPASVSESFSNLGEALSNLGDEFVNSDINTLGDVFDFIAEKFQKLSDVVMSNEGINTFLTNMKWFFHDLGEAFSLESISEKIEKTLEILGKMKEFFEEFLAPMFEDFSLGGAVAGGSGIAIIVGLFKALSTLDDVSKTLGAIPKGLGQIKDTLKAFQNSLNAEAIWDIAKSIGVLTLCLIGLSFVDMDRLIISAAALGTVGYLMLKGGGLLKSALKPLKTFEGGFSSLMNSIGKTFKQLGKSVKYFAIGTMFKAFAESIAIIVLSIAGLGYLWTTNSEMVYTGAKGVITIGAVVIGIMMFLSYIGESMQKGMMAMSQATKGILSLALAVGIIVYSIKTIMKMELPDDTPRRMGILAGAVISVGALVIAMGYASRLSMSMKFKPTGILTVCFGTILVVKALEMLMKIEFSEDWVYKCIVLAGIMAAVGGLCIAVGYAAKLAGGNGIKATGTIISMIAFVAVAVGMLKILSNMTWSELWPAVVSFAAIMLSLAAALAGAGQISEKTNWKSVLAMTLNVAIILAALGILSNVKAEKLLPAAVALGGCLLTLGAALWGASSISDNIAFPTLLAMCAAAVAISYALLVLSEQPWEGLIAGAGGLATCLLALAAGFFIISKSGDVKLDQVILFVTASIALLPIAIAIGMIAQYDWPSLLGAAGSLAIVLAALVICFNVIEMANPNLAQVGLFLLSSLVLIPIAIALYSIAGYEWGSLIAAGFALAEACIGLAAALVIISGAGINLVSVLGFVIASLALIPVAEAIKTLAEVPWQSALAAVIGIIAIIAVVAAVSVVLSTVSIEVLIVAAAMWVFAKAVQAFATGIDMMGDALLNFVVNILTATKALIEFFRALNPEDFYYIGYNIVMGLVQGIKGGLDALGDAIIEMCEGTVLWPILKIFGIASPSTVLAEIGKFLCQGFAIGVVENADVVSGSVKSTFGNLTQYIDTGIMSKAGGEASNKFAEGVSSKKIDIASIVSGVIDGANESVDTEQFEETGLESTEKLAQGFSTGAIDMESYMNEVMSQVAAQMDTSVFDMSGMTAAMDFGEGFGGYDIEGMMSEAMNSIGMNMDMSGMFDVGALGAQNVDFGFGSFDFSGMMSGAFDSALGNLDFGPMFETGLTGSTNVGEGFGSFDFKSMMSGAFTQASQGVDYAPMQQVGEEGSSEFVSSFKETTKLEIPLAANDIAFSMARWLRESIHENDFTSVGEDLIEEFCKAFPRSESTVTEKVQLMMSFAVSAIQGKNEVFGRAGTESAEFWITGVSKRYNLASTTAKEFAEKALSALQAKFLEFQQKGTESADRFIDGVQNRFMKMYQTAVDFAGRLIQGFASRLNEFRYGGEDAGSMYIAGLSSLNQQAYYAGQDLANQALLGLGILTETFYDYGSNAGEGFVQGLGSKLDSVRDVAEKIGNAAAAATQKALDEHSPSKVFNKIGEYATEGLADGMIDNVSLVEEAGRKVSNNAVDMVRTAVTKLLEFINQEDFSGDLTITPKVDLSNVRSGAKQISEMFSNAVENQNLNVSAAVGTFKYNTPSEEEETSIKKEDIKDLMLKMANLENQPKIENTFYIEGENPEEIAERVSTILQKQYVRRNAIWE